VSDNEPRIRELAYLLWEQAGRPEGRAEEFWFTAVQIFDEEDDAAAPPPTP
jgi:hypothetical protein